MLLKPYRLLLSIAAAIVFLIGYGLINDYLLSTTIKYFTNGYPTYGIKRLLMFFGGAGVLAILMLYARRSILYLVCGIVFLNAAVNFAFRSIAQDILTTEKSEWLFSEVGQLGNALVEFAQPVAMSTLRAAVAVGLLFFARAVAHAAMPEVAQRRATWGGTLLAVAPFGAVAIALAILDPSPIPSENNVSIGLVQSLGRTPPQPAQVTWQPGANGIDKLVLIVDESVRADTFRRQFGPEVQRLGGHELRDAWTAVPCSGGSNALMRLGINPERKYPADFDPRGQPTIFGYAAHAGYERYLFDAQSTGSVQNYMSANERALLTRLVPDSKGIDSDRLAAKEINELLRGPGRQLIYIVKRGAHFPYQRNLPPEIAAKEHEKAALYEQAVHYSNNEFFETLLAGVDQGKLLMIYTSDHGQNLDGDGLTHCNPVPRRDELVVPLWVWAPDGRNDFEQAPVGNQQTYSSLQIMPSLLAAMGYDTATVENTYYKTLWEGPTRPWLLRSPYLPYPARKAGPVRFSIFAPR